MLLQDQNQREYGFSAVFGEYFGNCVGDIHDDQARIQEYWPVGINGEWYHVFSCDNAADQPTGLDTTAHNIGLSSALQLGPDYVYLPREGWTNNQQFDDLEDLHILNSEILKK